MRFFLKLSAALAGFALLLNAADTAERARKMELGGDAQGARTLLRHAVEASPQDPAALAGWAEFLDYHNDPDAHESYVKLLAALPSSGANQQRVEVLHRLLELSLLTGDRPAAVRYLEQARREGAADLPASLPAAAQANPASFIEIPGPTRSFARMAALSPDIPLEDLLGALARNVVTNGYQSGSGAESLEQTEYLKLVVRYLSQARELERLAGTSKVIRIETCESEQTGQVLRILGYRIRGGCGSDVVLETVNATRAFLTVDSGFPVAALEQSLRTNQPFTYDYHPTRVPILYPADYWLGSKSKSSGEFIDTFLGDPALCRLYLGLSKLDPHTADEMRKVLPVQRIRVFAHVLDFYGGMFQIRHGKAVLPGGPHAAKAWEELVGVPAEKGAGFFERLIAKDDGWMASYFDALARIDGPVLAYLTEPERLKRFYMAIRGKITSPGPARPVFRANADMLLLTTRLRLETNGKPHVPGDLEVWRNLFIHHPHGKYDGKLTRLATTWKEPDDVLEALFALCRKSVDNEPLKIFMALSDVDRDRAKPLDAATVDRLARDYRHYGSQLTIFSETPALTDKSILQYLDTAQAVTQMKDQTLRADAAGILQALVSLWQVFCRQQLLPAAEADATFAVILDPFSKLHNSRDLFDAARSGVNLLLQATHSPAKSAPQDRLVDLLAGAAAPQDSDAHTLLVQDMMRILEAQRLVSLNVLFELADHLESLARGEKLNTALFGRLATRISEIQLPRAGLSAAEKNGFSVGYWSDRHVEAQRKLNLRAVVEKAGTDAEKLRDARGLLTPFVRDTLVGLNYAHYAPPGAQILTTNPLFVRNHDFVGIQGTVYAWRDTEVASAGWPSNAGGKLTGSLSALPYALAEAEQNFLIPSREQALIWGDLVPQMILSAKIPRWWNVDAAQSHWVSLHFRYAEALLAQSALSDATRQKVLGVLERQASPARVAAVARQLEAGDVKGAVERVTPSESFVLAAALAAPGEGGGGRFVDEIRSLASGAPDRINYPAISRAFGTPKPTLTNSYRLELLHLRTFPTLMGYSSRIMAESWECNTLYWAAVADELLLPPSQLNVLIPEWTRQMVERIFATHLEDWPALLRSMRMVADDVRSKMRHSTAGEPRAALQ
jgi:hypothetical protein